MGTIAEEVRDHLKPLVGLKLSVARLAADLRNFAFGKMRAWRKGTIGEYALHIQCPWRIEGPEGIITGRSDLWEPAEIGENFNWDTWHYDKGENLQDRRLRTLLAGYDPETRSIVNRTEHLVVESVQPDDCGGATICLSGGYKLVLFPAGSRNEDWRIFVPDTKDSHFIVSGGRIERDD